MTAKLAQSERWIRKRFVDDRKTPEEMAKEAKCSALTIRRRLKELGLLR